jgi:hypothetical protein
MMCSYAFGLGWTEVNGQQLESGKEWDPGDSTVLSSALNSAMVNVLQTSILPSSGIFTPPYMRKTQFREFQFLWDPGILNQMDMMLVLSCKLQTIASC